MKEIEQLPVVPVLEQLVEKQQKENLQLLGVHVMRIDGGKMWEVDLANNSAVPARYQENDVYDTKQGGKKQLIIKHGFIYTEAINSQNALRKAQKHANKYGR
jgi:hypothetical protein